MSKAKAWIEALRPRTLPLAVASTGLGVFIAWSEGLCDYRIALLSILTAVLLQTLSNLANDYGDYKHGADNHERIGPRRAVASGDITPGQMLAAVFACAILALVSGLSLIAVSFRNGFDYKTVLFILGGLTAIAAAIKYTAGKNPYGYRALGDLSVFIFFGLAGVMGTYYLNTHYLNWLVLMPASAFGMLSAAVLNLNNIRDYETDKKAGKITIVVKIGPVKALNYHYFLVGGAWLLFVIYSVYSKATLPGWAFMLVAPLYFIHLQKTRMMFLANPAALTQQLKQLSLSNLVFVVIFGVGNLV